MGSARPPPRIVAYIAVRLKRGVVHVAEYGARASHADRESVFRAVLQVALANDPECASFTLEKGGVLEVEVPTSVVDPMDTRGARIAAVAEAARLRVGLAPHSLGSAAAHSGDSAGKGRSGSKGGPHTAVAAAADVGRRIVSDGSSWMYRPMCPQDVYYVAPKSTKGGPKAAKLSRSDKAASKVGEETGAKPVGEYGTGAAADIIDKLREAVDDGRHVVWMPDSF